MSKAKLKTLQGQLSRAQRTADALAAALAKAAKAPAKKKAAKAPPKKKGRRR